MSEPNVVQTAFRLPISLLKRVDRYAKRLGEVTGLNVTRADAVRTLLHTALMRQEEMEKKNGKKK